MGHVTHGRLLKRHRPKAVFMAEVGTAGGLEMASTFCPSCDARVEHASDWTISVERDAQPEGTRTRFIANRILVIHVCTQVDAEDNPIST
jgi:hypothetical protein